MDRSPFIDEDQFHTFTFLVRSEKRDEFLTLVAAIYDYTRDDQTILSAMIRQMFFLMESEHWVVWETMALRSHQYTKTIVSRFEGRSEYVVPAAKKKRGQFYLIDTLEKAVYYGVISFMLARYRDESSLRDRKELITFYERKTNEHLGKLSEYARFAVIGCMAWITGELKVVDRKSEPTNEELYRFVKNVLKPKKYESKKAKGK